MSLLDRAYFRALHAKAVDVLGNRAIAQAYDDDEGFRALIDTALLLCGIPSTSIDMQTMICLLFGAGDIPALILDLNFPAPKPSDGEGDERSEDLSIFDPDAWAIATIWASTDDPVRAMAIANTPGWSFVAEVMRCRAKQSQMADPDYKSRLASQRTKREFESLIANDGIDKLNKLFDDPDSVVDPNSLRF